MFKILTLGTFIFALVACGGGEAPTPPPILVAAPTPAPVTAPAPAPTHVPVVRNLVTPLFDLSAAQVMDEKRILPVKQPGPAHFWRDKQGLPFNLYYNLNNYKKFKLVDVDYQQFYDRCRKEKTRELSLMLADTGKEYFVSGDSIIHGGGVSDPSYAYLQMIKDNFIKGGVTQATFPGRSLNNLVADKSSTIYTDDLTNHIVLFAWGMNDQVYQNADQYRKDFQAYIKAVKDRGAVHMIVFSTLLPDPEWNISFYDTIDAQNNFMRAERGDFVTYLDITDLLDPRSNPEIVLSEVNHPSNYSHVAHWFCFKGLTELG